ncbi:MAG: AAA domain-containing protein [Spirosomataceae bacterium]
MEEDIQEQQVWFEKLYRQRKQTAQTLMEDFAISNIWNSVVEKYSDQAHFIYELLQNANDAKATSSLFHLTKNGLYFRHNGTRNFWVSNPDSEKIDQRNNRLGDINAITAVAQSNKKDHSTIGKFGVGFKAVFQYTDTPHIYDPNFQFKISKFIVPIKLDNNLVDRQEGETVFYFPFDKQVGHEGGKSEMSQERAFADIYSKLKSLVFPTVFLSNLQEIKWKVEGSEAGEYTKKRIKFEKNRDLFYERLEVSQKVGSKMTKENLCLFSRQTKSQKLNYSVGFFLDNNDRLIPKEHYAFCFFPTKVTTNLNFIIHAPFLLTDSREGIKESDPHNIEMIEQLAKLSADSLLFLKDLKLLNDAILDIIPYKKKIFFESHYDYDEHENVEKAKFFSPFYKNIKQKFQSSQILPSTYGVYVCKENAYWAESPDLTTLFNIEQLTYLVENQNAKWVFTTIGRTKNKEITDYIDGGSDRSWDKKEPNLIKASLDFENKIADLITSNFIQEQSNEWLHKFYSYLLSRKSYQDRFKTKPIFKDSQGNAVAAFEKKAGELHSILFLPMDGINSSARTIDPELLKNEKTKEFLENFGIHKPSFKDEIYNNILPLYESNEGIDTRPHFEIFFKYWKEEGRPEDFINLIKDKSFILYKTNDSEIRYRAKASLLYFPDSDLLKYFEYKPDTRFVDLDEYHTFITVQDKQILKSFLLKLGVKTSPSIDVKLITSFDEKRKFNLSYSTGRSDLYDRYIDGARELTRHIDFEKSIMLWNILLKFDDLSTKLRAVHYYFYRKYKEERFDSSELYRLRNGKWLFTSNYELVAPKDINVNQLADGYKKNSDLEKLLGFKPLVVLTKTERIASKFGSEEEAEEALRALQEKREKERLRKEKKTSERHLEVETDDYDDAISGLKKISESIFKTNKEKVKTNSLPDFNEDEELARGIEEIKKQIEQKKNRVNLAQTINSSKKYSYNWFKAYLQLLKTFGEKNDTQKQKVISFQSITPYKASNKYLLLSGSNSYISPEIENADDFKVSLIFESGKRENILIEGVSKKGQDLLVYCGDGLASNFLSKLSSAFKVEIRFTPTIDLIDRLYSAFCNTNNIDEWEDIEDAMPPISYIYGPPGTGKTTKLCNDINEYIEEGINSKILVLTPTNKAADVICKKLLSINSSINVVRLSHPTSPELDEAIYRNELLDDDLPSDIDVVISTIHRLPYFNIEDYGQLFTYPWDYVIFDETSMIGLHYATFAIMSLYKNNSDTVFIVSGDPKQIPPVIEVNDLELENFDFQDENLYKMVNINSFNPNEQIIGSHDTIKNMDLQYRSLPQIGQLVSELSYSGLLRHDRKVNRREARPLPDGLESIIPSNVVFVDVPLNEEQSIYKVSKLIHSSYQVYCSILVAEIIKHFDKFNTVQKWTVGIITPYKAQAILLNKLISRYEITENISVYADTVHGFQGDECDIVFFVCNPNNYKYTGHPKALLSKEYIYNVAISRAKDYLIILHPYTVIPNNLFLNLIKEASEGNSVEISSKVVEKVIFGVENHIESNCYISGHDDINIFGQSDMKYFIKSSDTAIDFQLSI